MNNKALLYSTGDYIQYLLINYNGKEYEQEHICIQMKLSHFAVYQKLTQYCKSTILQLKKKKKPKFTADKLILASYHSSLSKYFM